ncbi:MAG: hypothetical protein ACFNLN_05135, partial [Treponema socranskii subsp. buccale]
SVTMTLDEIKKLPPLSEKRKKEMEDFKNQQPRRRASGYVVLIRWLQSGFNTLSYSVEQQGIKPSARIKIFPIVPS